MSVKREDVLKYLEEANMIEISELVKDIEDKFGVTAAVPVSYTHLTLPTNREV